MADLPRGWTTASLGEIVSPGRSRHAPSSFPRLPYVGMEHVESATGRLMGTASAKSMKSSAFRFSPKDILYGRLRPYLNKVHLAQTEGLCSSEFIVLPPSEVVLPEFLAYQLRHRRFVEFANQQNQGDRPRVSFDQISTFELVLPPKDEQRRIVARVEELLANLDVCKDSLTKAAGLLRQFRQSVLAAACSGKLTGEWRRGAVMEPSQLRPVEPDAALNLDLPEGWIQVHLGELLESLKYGTARRCDYSKKGVPVLRIPNVKGGVVDCSDLKYAVLPKAELNELALELGDLLMVRSNGSVSLVGRASIVRDAEVGYAYAGYLMRLRSNKRLVNQQYLSLALRLPSTRTQIEVPARSTSGVHNINGKEVRALVLPLPPLKEQAEIVRRVDSLLGGAEQIEAHYQKAVDDVEKMAQSILTEAFCGELAPQNPRDEPASSLLERIRAKELEAARA